MSQQSEQINEIMTALAKAQGQMEAAITDSSNPHFKSKYADLASVWDACRNPLSKHGLAVTQTLDFIGEKQVLITTLGHTSGQWIKSTIALPIQKNGPHELGSCITYCRRYSLASIVGISPEDDDGNKAQKPFEKESPKPKPIAQPLDSERINITDADWAHLDLLVDTINDNERINKLATSVDAGSIYEVSPKHFDRVIRSLEKAVRAMEPVDEPKRMA